MSYAFYAYYLKVLHSERELINTYTDEGCLFVTAWSVLVLSFCG